MACMKSAGGNYLLTFCFNFKTSEQLLLALELHLTWFCKNLILKRALTFFFLSIFVSSVQFSANFKTHPIFEE